MGRLRFTAARHPLRPSESGARPHRLDHQAPACVGDVQRGEVEIMDLAGLRRTYA